MKKKIAMLLTMTMVSSLLVTGCGSNSGSAGNASGASVASEGSAAQESSIAQESVVTISTPAQLNAFASKVNGGDRIYSELCGVPGGCADGGGFWYF